MNKLLKFSTKYWKPISIAFFISLLCFVPASEINKIHVKITFADLIVHFLMFFAFTGALYFDINKYKSGQHNYPPLAVALLISITLAISTETLQFLLTFLHRSGSFVDLIFDIIGSLAGIGAVEIIKSKPAAER